MQKLSLPRESRHSGRPNVPGRLWLSLVPLLMAGCATVDAQKTQINQKQATRADARELPRLPLMVGQPLNVKLDEASAVLSFSSGNSHAAALSLPPATRPQILHFKIRAQGWTSYTETTFCPVLQFLRADGEPLSTLELATAWVAPGWTTNGYFEGFAEVPEPAASVIVYTRTLESRQSAAVHTVDSGFVFSTGKSTVYVPGSGRHTIRMPCAPTGAFAVTVLEPDLSNSDSRTGTGTHEPSLQGPSAPNSSGACDKWGNPKDANGNPCRN